ncbi:MAG: long-chain fatty acid--CoA ligase [Myxococcales bacterium]|nr:long-chain fatty acid--CoA ligase [Myxococcales bacterium]
MQTADSRDLVLDRLWQHARVRPSEPALYQKNSDGEWRALTFADYRDLVHRVAASCVAAGMPEGGSVGIFCENRVEWVLAALGAQAAGGMASGIYMNSTDDQAVYILAHCEATIAVVDGPRQVEHLLPHLAKLPKLRRIVVLTEPDVASAFVSKLGLVVSWQEFLDSGKGHEQTVDERFARLTPETLASLIYTSGTTGSPKGVMLSHHNLAWTARTGLSAFQVDRQDVMVSYLPLSHIAEQMLTIYVAICAGMKIYFAGGLDKLKETLLAARPTVLFGVPRVWEKLQSALTQRLAEQKPFQRRIIAWARDVGSRVGHYRLESGSPFGLLAVEEIVARKLFFTKIRTTLGLERLRFAVSGAAALRKDVVEFFLSLSIPIHEVYGLSESTGPLTLNPPAAGQTRVGTVGRPLAGTTLKLASDGEILFRGPNVALGYFKDPAATAQTFQDGWLHTGDIGEQDDAGFLRITDRKKDLLRTSGGKYIAPQPIESLLRALPLVSQAVVVGEGRKFVAALLTLDPERASQFAQQHSLPVDRVELIASDKFRQFVSEQIDQLNAQLARFEQIKRYTVLPTEFSIERDEVTPTQKLRRKVITKNYAAEIDAMYANPEGSESA